MNDVVSIIIPTKNSGLLLENTLKSIKNQSYKHIETIVIDGASTDNTVSLVRKYKFRLYTFKPKVKSGTFDATHKRNLGVKKAKGKYVYYLDSDMELPKGLIAEAVSLCKTGYDALILPEESFGIGIWAKAKNLERQCYFGDTGIEAPRFFIKSVWEKVGGLDEKLASGRDDGDLYYKLLENGFKVGRTKNIVMHNEGELTLSKLYHKKVMYGKDVMKYVSKRPKVGLYSYFPIRPSYFRNWKLFVKRPLDSLAFVVMKTIESSGGVVGVISSLKERNI